MATATAASANCGAVPATVSEHCRPLSFDRRQRLILENLVEVRRVARRICARLPKHVPFDDLVHSGVLGLIDAVEKFNPAKNVSLQAYAQIRIRGAILDSLREMDWGPRTLRWQARRIEQARSALIARLGRYPSEMEVAELLVLRLDKYQHILTQLHSLAPGKRQGLPESTSGEKARLAPSIRVSEDPFQLCARAESTRMLTEAIKTLGAKERKTLALYYFEERTMKEVGTLLKIQESRVSQIISAALDRLRAHLQERLIPWPHPG